VEISQSINRKVSSLNASASFVCKTLNQATMPAADKAALLAFQQKVGELSRALDGAGRYYNEMSTRMKYVKEAIKVTPDAPLSLMNDAKTIELRMHKLDEVMWGDGTRSSREFETPPAISDRVGVTVYNLLQSTSAPSQTAKDNYRIATEEFPAVLTELKSIASALAALESKLEQNGAPWTPGRLPKWEAQ
jgi:hypothetical protein